MTFISKLKEAIEPWYSNTLTKPEKAVYYSNAIQTDETTIAYLMSGMRFQSGPQSAFQIALAGIFYQDDTQVVSFPVPQSIPVSLPNLVQLADSPLKMRAIP